MKILLPFLLLLVGCIERVDEVVLDATADNLVVYGTLNNTPGPHRVEIGRTVRLSSSRTNRPVVGLATVQLLDEDDNVWDYVERGAGVYTIPAGTVTPQEGTAYRIRIVDAVQQIDVESQPERMPPRVTIDTVRTDVVRDAVRNQLGEVRDRFLIDATVEANLPDQPVNLRWEVIEVWNFAEIPVPSCPNCPPPATCFFTESPEQTGRTYNGFVFPTERVERRVVRRELTNEAYQSRHYFNVYQHSVSSNALRYFEELDLIRQQGGLFDVPPGALLGNLVNNGGTEPILGYFQVGPTDTLRTFVTRNTIEPFPLETICPLGASSNPADYPRECFRCEELFGASFERPWWF